MLFHYRGDSSELIKDLLLEKHTEHFTEMTGLVTRLVMLSLMHLDTLYIVLLKLLLVILIQIG